MPTVVVRFEPNKKNPERGTIYYRIYKGHNRRMEFSSRLHLSASSWDETARTIRDDYPESCRFRVQIEADYSAFEPDYNRRYYRSTDNG